LQIRSSIALWEMAWCVHWSSNSSSVLAWCCFVHKPRPKDPAHEIEMLQTPKHRHRSHNHFAIEENKPERNKIMIKLFNRS
jgi:hypothetical protein